MTLSANIIVRPRATEKATFLKERPDQPVYTFEVHPLATKGAIAEALKALYKVKPLAVRIVKLPAKSVLARGGVGTKPGIKKALVTLKKGEKIEAL